MHYRIAPSPNIGARSFGDEVVVANFISGVYYSLLGSAAQVWEGLMAGLPLDEVSSAGAAVGGVDPATFAAAAETLAADLGAEGLLVEGTTSEAAPWTPAPPDGEGYGLPALERYTDMQELLLLDPVHDVEEMGWPHAGPADAT